MKIIAVSQARFGSTRLPGKVLLEIGDESLLEMHIRRVKESSLISDFILATTTDSADDEIKDFAINLKVNVFRGSMDDVLDRYYQAVLPHKPDYVVRVTSDCPLIDPKVIDAVIECCIEEDLDYCSNTLKPTYPDGQDVEVFKFSALEKAWNDARLASEREHVTPFIKKHSTFNQDEMFTSKNFDEGFDYEHVRLTVDEIADFEVISGLVDALGSDKDWLTYTKHLLNDEDLRTKNASIGRDEGLTKSLKNDKYVK